jgi:hypothetical protein
MPQLAQDEEPGMPRDTITMADVREPTLTIVCERCGRHGRYNIAPLVAAHGADAKLTELLDAYSRTRGRIAVRWRGKGESQ